MPTPYDQLYDELARHFRPDCLIRDPLRLLALGTDASFYRLVPKLAVQVDDERDVQRLLQAAARCQTPLTFRAAGTSLSGQAVSDSVLVLLGAGWQGCTPLDDGQRVRLQPGVIGAEANRRLLPFGRKIGPDPASIQAARIGGIAANNASGMCCGTADNSYHTLDSMRLIFADGSVLDTADPLSRQSLASRRPDLLAGLQQLAADVQANPALAERIRHKYRIKNTTGYGLNALVDFDDPFEILQHLMIGSEGTLGFIAEITLRTVPEHAHRATALLFFPDMATACSAIPRLRVARVAAAELMDRPALRAVQGKPGMPELLASLPEAAAALLVEVRGADRLACEQAVAEACAALDGLSMLAPLRFDHDPKVCEGLWKVRKGLFPAVGAVRPVGSTVIIEDVAVPPERLAEAAVALQALLHEHGYPEAILFGHALEGNLHFVFTQAFEQADDVERYRRVMDEVCRLVVGRFDGSMKAEHGTGRNVAPFVAEEWGAEAYALMQRIKHLFDPQGLLNPGVILNDDPEAHLRHLKPLPAADPLVDRCIECGFCEPVCPSRHLTLTPRQRIVLWRDISQRRRAGEAVQALEQAYRYPGLDTCAMDGLCSTRCPVGINTGDLVRQLRAADTGALARRLAETSARHMGWTLTAARQATAVAGLARVDRLPAVWGDRPPLPAPAGGLPELPQGPDDAPLVVYFPGCANRVFAQDRHDDGAPLPATVATLLQRAGLRGRYPAGLRELCCGLAHDSAGHPGPGVVLRQKVAEALLAASEQGRWPVLIDASACTLRMVQGLDDRLRLLEPARFAREHLLPRLHIRQQEACIALHVTCSSTRLGVDADLLAVARACAREVIVPGSVSCCGFAGSAGFTHPELNRAALQGLADELPAHCTHGYSSNRTCEIGLSERSGRPYQNLLLLVEAASRPAVAG